MSIPITALMCHAPVVVPPVGRESADACASTTAAMRRVAEAVVAARPHVVIVISPHTPRTPDDWRLVCNPTGTDQVRVNFSEFEAPNVRFALPAAVEARARLSRLALQHGLHTETYEPELIDQGAAVPLWFLLEAGWAGPTMVIGLPWREGTEAVMGEALRAISGQERWAVIASGDMSHRLRPTSPAGFDKRAQAFDSQVVQALKAGDLRYVADLDPDLRKVAAEDVVAPVTVAAAASRWKSDNGRVFCYEGPYGVGYCAAILYAEAVGAQPRAMPASVAGNAATPRRR
jgi:MEMO1 family protein